MDPTRPFALSAFSLFGGVVEPHLSRIAARLRHVRYGAGVPLIVEGDHDDRVFVIAAGRVEVCKQRRDGSSRTLAVLGPGSTVGEMEIIDLQARSCTVVALDPVEALALERADLLALKREHLETFAVLALNLARDLSRRLRHMDEVVAQEE